MGTALTTGGVFGFGSKTAAAGTKIRYLIPPKTNYRTVLTYLSYISGPTQHTLTLMRPVGETTVRTAAAAGQAVVGLTADPGAVAQMRTRSGGTSQLAANELAVNDNVVVALPDGTYFLDLLASIKALDSFSYQLTTNLPTGGVSAGAKFWHFGVEADSEPADAVAHWTLKPPTSAARVYRHDDGFFATALTGQPILIVVDNVTDQGTLEGVAGYYGAA